VMPQPPNGQSTRSMPEALQQATGRNDQKSVDELLKYINGEGAGKQSSKKKTTNPKKRQQQKA
jgi:protein TIF31